MTVRRRSRSRAKRPGINALITLVVLLVGCAGGKPQTTGFLGDYSQLEPGRGDQARLRYIDRDANFARYESVIVDRVVAWGGADELQPLADHFDAALRRQLQLDFALVGEPRPGSMQLRAAVALTEDSRLSIEVEILDATSGERLIAAVDDRRVASGHPEEARADLDAWADVIRQRLSSFRHFDAAHHPSHSP